MFLKGYFCGFRKPIPFSKKNYTFYGKKGIGIFRGYFSIVKFQWSLYS